MTNFDIGHVLLLVALVVFIFFASGRCKLTCNTNEGIQISPEAEALHEAPDYFAEFCKSIHGPFPPQHGTVGERNNDRTQCEKAGYTTTPRESSIGLGPYWRIPWENSAEEG